MQMKLWKVRKQWFDYDEVGFGKKKIQKIEMKMYAGQAH